MALEKIAPHFRDIVERIQTDYEDNPHKSKQQNIADLEKKLARFTEKTSEPTAQQKAYVKKIQEIHHLLDILKAPEAKTPIQENIKVPTKNVHTMDLLERKTTDDLVKKWEEEPLNYATRDKLVEEMMKQGVRPDTWISDRDIATGLYPDIDDPDFAAKLTRKTEFASLRSSAIDEDTCARSKQQFEKTAVQRLIARFLHPSTPYNGILLHHGVGVGKTCSAITVAETFLEILPMNTVYIIVPQAIADGFRKTIFDAGKLRLNTAEEFRLTGERWVSPQCTGSTYLHLTGTADSNNVEEIIEAVDQEVKRRYKIMGYLAFANFVEAKKKEVPAALTGQDRIDAEHAKLISLFSDHLLIIDEAHNLRDAEEDGDVQEADKTKASDAKEGKKLTPILKQIVRVAEGLRLMLMTATPMYNTAPEILFLLNLLHLNDAKDDSSWLKTREIFKEVDSSFVEEGEKKLVKLIKRYVSFMRGEHPNTFPLRLTPVNSISADFEYPTVSMKISEGEILNMKPAKEESLDRKIMYSLPLVVHTVNAGTQIGKTLEQALRTHIEKDEPEGGREVTNLDSFIQMGNFVYPDGTFGKTGFANYFEEKKLQKLTQYTWKKKSPTIDSVFGSGLREHSPKIAAIVESVTRAKGMSFVFSRYKKAGAIPIAIALEMAGWCRVLANGTQAPLLRREFAKPPTMFYVLLTSDELISPDFKGLLQYATTLKTAGERNGSKVKAILGSQIASEGLDLKCIRELHLLEGWFHLNRIEQIEGRGVRYCSHSDLHITERNCLIYLHALNVQKYETPDLYMYRIATRKAQPIGRITRLMKIHAWDCMLNRDAILLSNLPSRDIVDAQGRPLKGYDLQDKPFSSFCDFSENCEFQCVGKRSDKENNSTYTKEDFHKKLLYVQTRIAELFSDEVAKPLDDIRAIYKINGIPWAMAEIGLREMLGKVKIQRSDGIIGTLIPLNGYIVFQPEKVTDVQIPLALRYGRAYGLIPREFTQTRPILSIGATEGPIDLAPTAAKKAKDKKQKEKTLPEPNIQSNNMPSVNYADSMKEFMHWKAMVEDILTKPSGNIEPPGGMKKEPFRGWRWTFYHFRSLPEIRSIAYRWWMDNFWSWSQLRNALTEWTAKGLTEYLDLFTPNEVFSSSKIKGFYSCDSNNVIKIFCLTGGDTEPKICPSVLVKDVEALLGKPVDRMNDTGKVFGYLTYLNNVMTFRTVLKEGRINLKGAQCVGNSVLDYQLSRMKEINASLRKHIGPLILDDTEATKPNPETSKERKTYVTSLYEKSGVEDSLKEATHLEDLTLKQICPYLEFLLRYADIQRIDGKRWFLSAVEMARIGK